MSVPTASKITAERALVRRRKHAPGHSARMRFVALALTPIMLLFFTFSFLPIGVSIFLSFYRYSPLDMNAPFIGLRNYTFAFTKDPAFTASLWNTLKYVLIAVPLNIVLTLPIALALNQIKRFKAFFRAVYFMPAIRLFAVTNQTSRPRSVAQTSKPSRSGSITSRTMAS